MGLRGPQPIFTGGEVKVLLTPEQRAEVERLAGSGHGARARWLREAIDQRLIREKRKEAPARA
jgi:hypothetical protein